MSSSSANPKLNQSQGINNSHSSGVPFPPGSSATNDPS